MKFFVIALSLVAICSCFTRDDVAKDTKFTQECNAELGIRIKESNKYDRNTESYIDDPTAQNYAKCLFQKYGFIDQNGDFQESVAIETLSTGEIVLASEEQVKQCRATAGDNKANAFAIKLYACYNAAGRLNYL